MNMQRLEKHYWKKGGKEKVMRSNSNRFRKNGKERKDVDIPLIFLNCIPSKQPVYRRIRLQSLLFDHNIPERQPVYIQNQEL